MSNLSKIASRVAILFGSPPQKKYFEDYVIAYDNGYPIGEPSFYLQGIFNSPATGRQEEVETMMDFYLDGELDEANYIGIYNYNQRQNPAITDELEAAIRDSEEFKKLVDQLKNPSPAQQQKIQSASNPKKITMKDYLE